MAIFDLNQVPKFVTIELRSNTALYPSPLTASIQTLDRGGAKWRIVYTYDNLRDDNRGELMGLIASLRGQTNRLRVPVFDNPSRGAYGGSPNVDGASQTGSSIDIKGCSNNITDWIKAGDYFSINVNGEHELKMATADASSNGSGLITVSFEPRLRDSPLNSAVIYVGDGGNVPQGIFMLAESAASWSTRPGIAQRMATSLEMLEDVFATQ